MSKEPVLINNVWAKRSLGLDLSQNIYAVTTDDVKYITNYFYPFLQVINSEAVFDSETRLNFLTTSSGWVIHDYGDAISTAMPHSVTGSKKSTIIEQITVAAEFAHLIATKRWSNIEIIAGTSMLLRLLWVESKRYTFGIKGYEPSAEDEKYYHRLMKRAKEKGVTWEKHVPEKPRDKLEVSGAS